MTVGRVAGTVPMIVEADAERIIVAAAVIDKPNSPTAPWKRKRRPGAIPAAGVSLDVGYFFLF